MTAHWLKKEIAETCQAISFWINEPCSPAERIRNIRELREQAEELKAMLREIQPDKENRPCLTTSPIRTCGTSNCASPIS